MISGDQTCCGVSLLISPSMERPLPCCKPGCNLLCTSHGQPQVPGSETAGAAGLSWCGRSLGALLKVQYLAARGSHPSCPRLLTSVARAGASALSGAEGLLCHRHGLTGNSTEEDDLLWPSWGKGRAFHECKDYCPSS